MRVRIPLLTKKRGERRTGVRWLGRLSEALVYVVLLIVGVLALAMLFVGALPRPWPWVIAIIPASLVVYGVLGLMEAFWEASTSSELRSAVAKKAGDLEALLVSEHAVHQLPTVPPIDDIVDSPGVRLAYRLPIDTSPSLLLFTMTLLGVGANLLVAMFVYQVVELHRQGQPNWMLTWLLVPFVLAGVWTLVALAREILMSTGLGTTRVEISTHPLRAGEKCHVFLSQTGRVNVRWLKVLAVCEERATFSQGTDTRTETIRVHRLLLCRARKFDVRSDQPYEGQFEFTVPPMAMHSFRAPHNSVAWALLVRGKVARWPIFERRFPVVVHPDTPATAPPPTRRDTQLQEAGK